MKKKSIYLKCIVINTILLFLLLTIGCKDTIVNPPVN